MVRGIILKLKSDFFSFKLLKERISRNFAKMIEGLEMPYGLITVVRGEISEVYPYIQDTMRITLAINISQKGC